MSKAIIKLVIVGGQFVVLSIISGVIMYESEEMYGKMKSRLQQKKLKKQTEVKQ